MKKDIQETKELSIVEPQNLDKPQQDTEFAHKSAQFLMDIVKKNNWARRLGGQSDHLQYEAWQTVGKYYGYAVKTKDAEYVEFGNSWGFKAKATVVNEHTGIEVGGAEAYCMNDENNWRSKPKFQLASMAQTRAGSKALRQILGFVVALAGYSPTPAEEMVTESIVQPRQGYVVTPTVNKPLSPVMASDNQKLELRQLQIKAGKTRDDMENAIHFLSQGKKATIGELTTQEAEVLLVRMRKLPEKKGDQKQMSSEPEINMDEVDEGITKMQQERLVN